MKNVYFTIGNSGIGYGATFYASRDFGVALFHTPYNNDTIREAEHEARAEAENRGYKAIKIRQS